MFSALVRRVIFSRAFQEKADTFRQMMLLGHFDGKWDLPLIEDPAFESTLQRQYALSFAQHKDMVHESAHRQVLTLFDRTTYVVTLCRQQHNQKTDVVVEH
jgi:hypothetical protein